MSILLVFWSIGAYEAEVVYLLLCNLTLYICWLLEKPNATYAHSTRGHGTK